MDPPGPSQPTTQAAYTTAGNPATTNPAEQQQQQTKTQSHQHPPASGNPVVDQRGPATSGGLPQEEATPSSLGRGGRHGAPAGEEQFGKTEADVGRGRENDGEQMRAPAEGDVADVVRRKPGAGGAQPDLAGGLERKKAEQAELREAVKEERKHGLVGDGADVQGGVQT